MKQLQEKKERLRNMIEKRDRLSVTAFDLTQTSRTKSLSAALDPMTNIQDLNDIFEKVSEPQSVDKAEKKKSTLYISIQVIIMRRSLMILII
jgi:hypothetical protein